MQGVGNLLIIFWTAHNQKFKVGGIATIGHILCFYLQGRADSADNKIVIIIGQRSNAR